MKKHINQLLRELEENEDYSEREWEKNPRLKSSVKEVKLNQIIILWHPIPLSDDYRLPNAYKTGELPVPIDKIQSKLSLLERKW